MVSPLCPVFRNADEHSSSYKPINFLSVVSKHFEDIINMNFVDPHSTHIVVNNCYFLRITLVRCKFPSSSFLTRTAALWMFSSITIILTSPNIDPTVIFPIYHHKQSYSVIIYPRWFRSLYRGNKIVTKILKLKKFNYTLHIQTYLKKINFSILSFSAFVFANSL